MFRLIVGLNSKHRLFWSLDLLRSRTVHILNRRRRCQPSLVRSGLLTMPSKCAHAKNNEQNCGRSCKPVETPAPHNRHWNNDLRLSESTHEPSLECRRRFQTIHPRCQRVQTSSQHFFVSQTCQAIDTLRAVRQRFTTHIGFHYLVSRQLTCNAFESLTIHAKHLADSTAVELSNSVCSPLGLNLVCSRERARCRRDRTVPIAQPRASAVSP